MTWTKGEGQRKKPNSKKHRLKTIPLSPFLRGRKRTNQKDYRVSFYKTMPDNASETANKVTTLSARERCRAPRHSFQGEFAEKRGEFWKFFISKKTQTPEKEISNQLNRWKPLVFVVFMPDARRQAVAIATNFRLGKCDAGGIPPPAKRHKKMHHRSTAVHPTILSERSITLWCIRCHLRLPYTQELLTHEQVFECICQVGRFFRQTFTRQLIPSLLFYHHLATTIIY